MKAVTVVADDRVGLLADVSYILSKAKINLEGVSVDICSGRAVIAITVKNPVKAENVLKDNGYDVIDSETLVIKHPRCSNCKNEIMKMLAIQRIAIDKFDMITDGVDKCVFAMHVNRPRKAVKILGDYLINGPA